MANKFLRKCIGCGAYKKKEELIKITKTNTNEIYINPKSNVYGRSTYICRDENCVNNAFKKMKISKILKQNVSINLKDEIMTILES
ncbi:MAG: YlxR family protein [Candidatus Gastranaerophilales bacterium]|nr:YlxR family protein [Candidatus Gastranaerophilales bacterium]